MKKTILNTRNLLVTRKPISQLVIGTVMKQQKLSFAAVNPVSVPCYFTEGFSKSLASSKQKQENQGQHTKQEEQQKKQREKQAAHEKKYNNRSSDSRNRLICRSKSSSSSSSSSNERLQALEQEIEQRRNVHQKVEVIWAHDAMIKEYTGILGHIFI